MDFRLLLQELRELWGRERGLSRVSAAYPPSFHMYLKDPHANWKMIEGLEGRYKVEECSFNTIFGSFQGHKIYVSRKWQRRSRFTDPSAPATP